MRALPRLSLSATLLLWGACDKGSSDSPAATTDPETAGAEPASPPVPRLEGTIEIPAAIPSGAIAIVSVRVPSSMFASVLRADPMGLAMDGIDDLKKVGSETGGRATTSLKTGLVMQIAYFEGRRVEIRGGRLASPKAAVDDVLRFEGTDYEEILFLDLVDAQLKGVGNGGLPRVYSRAS